MKILVAGGGTAGHIMPNLAVLGELGRLGGALDVLYVGAAGGMEERMVTEAGWKFCGISCGKLRRYWSWDNLLDLWRTKVGIWQSLGIILKFKPDVIFCKGGYVSLPVAVAGGMLRRKVIIHESDAEMGLANRIAMRFARKVFLSFPNPRYRGERVVVTGNPVRAELRDGVAEKGWEFTGLKPGRKVLLVMGGSQGAEFINELVWKNRGALLDKFWIIHVFGKGKLPDVLREEIGRIDGYFACEFLGAELADIYAITDVALCRSGANSLAELDFLGLPAVLVPLVYGSRGDQVLNAEIYKRSHRAIIVDEKKTDPAKYDLVSDLEKLLAMHHKKEETPVRNPAVTIASLIVAEAKNGKS